MGHAPEALFQGEPAVSAQSRPTLVSGLFTVHDRKVPAQESTRGTKLGYLSGRPGGGAAWPGRWAGGSLGALPSIWAQGSLPVWHGDLWISAFVVKCNDAVKSTARRHCPHFPGFISPLVSIPPGAGPALLHCAHHPRVEPDTQHMTCKGLSLFPPLSDGFKPDYSKSTLG